MHQRPPRISEWIARLFVSNADENAALGDLQETYTEMVSFYGSRAANRWYRNQVMRSIPWFILRNLSFTPVMIRNYLTVALRTFRRHTGYATINLTGLVTGLTCVLLIGVYLEHELTYDRFHEKADRIHRVVLDLSTPNGTNHLPSGPSMLSHLLNDRVPEVERLVKMHRPEQITVEAAREQYREESLYYVDSTFTDVFTVDVIRGDAASMLSAPSSIVLTEPAADKYFGSTDVVGERMVIGDTLDVTVTGVVRPFPSNSHFQFNALVSVETMRRYWADYDQRWAPHVFFTYALLSPGADPDAIESRLPGYVDDAVSLSGGYSFTFLLQRLTDIHLRSDRPGDLGVNSSIERVTLFGSVALLVLLIACLNFMNLATARSSTRTREVGMRKVLGARRMQLVGQFTGEAVVYALVSAVIALGVAVVIFPWFQSISGIELHRSALLSARILTGLMVLALSVGLLAGSYPSFVLSSFKPLGVLKSTGRTISGGATVRKVLVVGQFAVSLFLIVGTVVVLRQLDYMQSRELGYDEEQVIVVSGLSAHQMNQAQRFREQASGLASTEAIALTNTVPGRSIFSMSYNTSAMEAGDAQPIDLLFADPSFTDVYNVDVLAGRSFSRTLGDDSSAVFLINRSAALESGWQPEEAVGQEITWSRGEGTVIGVVEDFHFSSLHERVKPMLIFSSPLAYNSAPLMLSVRLAGGDIGNSVERLARIWDEVTTGQPFEYFFLDADFDRQYRADERLATLMSVFGGLAILIACLGLFGLATLMAEQRQREIGIRKVLGATVGELSRSFTIDFLKLVGLAIAVAVPVTWYAAQNWLSGYAYRIELGAGSFVFGAAALILLATLTVSYQSIRAATSNPVDVLRAE